MRNMYQGMINNGQIKENACSGVKYPLSALMAKQHSAHVCNMRNL